jgi:peptide/nickel transport system substrate-binding protein
MTWSALFRLLQDPLATIDERPVGRQISSTRWLSAIALAAWFCAAIPASAAQAQKVGGTLRIYNRDSPPSMSILEESALSTVLPMMGVFNNLVVYDQHVAQNSQRSIVPELATQWSWNEEGTQLSFKLRRGVRWHDGAPFTAGDVRCTWDLLTGKSDEKLSINPRRSWYDNLKEVTAEADDEVTFVLKRRQPSLLALLASGFAPIYPCHVPPHEMRRHPIGTGPFKFIEFHPNERIRVTRNPDYWKNGRPFLDGIEYTIVPNRGTALLAFETGKFDMTWPFDVPIPLLKEVRSQAPHAVCETTPLNASRNLIINRNVPPFGDPAIRQAMALSLDRREFIYILDDGQGDVGGAMLPPPDGVWGLPAELLRGLPGYGRDVEKSRAQARAIMERAGYGPDKRLQVRLTIRNIPIIRDPAIILINQLKTIYIDAELDPVESVNWFPKVFRKDYAVGLNMTASAIDDPDQQFYENYACGAQRNITGYCNRELEKEFARESMEVDPERRKHLVWAIDRKLQEDDARPIIFYYRAASCRQPYVKDLTIMVNSIYNGWRFEDLWLDR